MNSVSLVGNLASEVEVREIGDGKKVAHFLLAVDRVSKDDQADFVRVSAWDRQAELCGEFLVKGRLVGVVGRLRSSTWSDGDGNRRYGLEVTAARVEFLGRAERSGEEAPFEAAAAA